MLSLLFSVSVLNGHGHLFSYRTYYATNSLAWEEKKTNPAKFLVPATSSAAQHTQYCSYSPSMHWFVQSHPTHCSGPEQSQIKSGTVPCCVVVFPAPSIPVGFADVGSNAVARCDRTDRQTPQAQGHCGPKSGRGSPESTHLP